MRICPAIILAVLASFRLAAADTEMKGYRIVAERPVIAEETRKNWQAKEFIGTPDWGLCIEDAAKRQCVLRIDDGGTGYIEVPAGATVDARLVEIDPDGFDNVSERVAFSLSGGKQALAFADGSQVAAFAEPFDPDAMSGGNAKPAGATAVRFDQLQSGSVSFVKQHRTECWAVSLEKRSWVVGLVYCPDFPLLAEWVPTEGGMQKTTEFHNCKGVMEGSVCLFRGFLDAGRNVLRLRARPGAANGDYRLLFVRSDREAENEGAIVRGLFDIRSLEKGPFAGSLFGITCSVCHTLSSTEVREAVLAALDHKDENARELAVSVVGNMDLREAQPRLEKMSQDDPSRDVRSAAASILKGWARRKR